MSDETWKDSVNKSEPVLRVAFLSETRQPAVVLTDLIAWMKDNAVAAAGTPTAQVHQAYIDTLVLVLADATGRQLP